MPTPEGFDEGYVEVTGPLGTMAVLHLYPFAPPE